MADVDEPCRLVQTPLGPYWLPDGYEEDGIVAAMRRGEVHDRLIAERVCAAARSRTTVIDAGACLGQMSCLFAEVVGPDGLVAAVEPDPSLASLARATFRERGLSQVIVYPNAAWNESGRKLSFRGLRSGTHVGHGRVLIQDAAVAETVWSLALEDLPLDRPVSAVKIDVEGQAVPVLLGMHRLLTRDRPVVVVEIDPVELDGLASFLDQVDYRVVGTVHDACNFVLEPRQ